MKAKIIEFTKFEDGQDKDCVAITDRGEKILVDPFVGCSWEYENRHLLINEWFEDNDAFQSDDGAWLTSEEGFRLLGDNSTSTPNT